MSGQDLLQLTLFPEDSPASRFPLQGSSEAWKMNVTFGQKCSEWSESFSHLGLLERMLKTQSEWSPTKSCVIWKASATKQGRLLYRLTASVRGTKGTECLSWPRPTTGAALCGGTYNFRQMQMLCDAGQITEEERRNLTQGNGGRSNPDLLEWLMGFPIGWSALNA